MLTALWSGFIITLIIFCSLFTGCWLAFYVRSKDGRRSITAVKYWITNPTCRFNEIQIILGIGE